MEHRLDSMLDQQDRDHDTRFSNEEVAEIVRSGKYGPMTLLGVEKKSPGNFTVYLDPSQPRWTCPSCDGHGGLWYRVKGGKDFFRTCYTCRGKGFLTDARKVRSAVRKVGNG